MAIQAQASVDAHLAQKIRKELQQLHSGHKTLDLEPQLQAWQHNYGLQAVEVLHSLAQDRSLEDLERYTATVAMTRIGGPGVLGSLQSLLKDRSWMVRMGALRGIHLVRPSGLEALLLPLLRDPALVIRNETVTILNREVRIPSPTLTQALIGTLKDPQNYHAGEPLWVPGQSLTLLQRSELDTQALSTLRDLAQKSSSVTWRKQLSALILRQQSSRTIGTR